MKTDKSMTSNQNKSHSQAPNMTTPRSQTLSRMTTGRRVHADPKKKSRGTAYSNKKDEFICEAWLTLVWIRFMTRSKRA